MSNLNSTPGNIVSASGRDAAEPTSPRRPGRGVQRSLALFAGTWLGMGTVLFFGFLIGHQALAEKLRSVGS